MNASGLLFSVGDGPDRPLGDLDRIDLPAGRPASFDLASGGHWFGHGFAGRQPWPLQAEPVVNDRFAVNNCQSPIWMCQAGVAILADTAAELSVRCNAAGDGRLRLCCPGRPGRWPDALIPNLHLAVARLASGRK